MNARQLEHCKQFAAGFELITFGQRETANALLRQVDSFIVVERKFDRNFETARFVNELVASIRLFSPVLSREVANQVYR